MRPQATWWIWDTSIWIGLGLFDATKTVFVMRSEGMHHAWTALFITLLLSRLPWAPATPAVIWLDRSYPLLSTKLTTWLLHLGAAATMGVLTSAWYAGFEKLLNPWAYSANAGRFVHLWKDGFYDGLLESFFLYAAILATARILEARNRLLRQETEKARLSEQLAKAQLNALRRQIEPHFLFNTLNSISAQVREGRNDSAVEMIVALSEVLRSVIADSNRQEVTLGSEVEILQKYLDIQKTRFAERLQVKLEVPQELSSALVPGLILQPMVENAIQHGIAKRARGGAIEITAVRSNGFITLSVYNDGPQLADSWEETSSGVGISNLRNR